MSGLAASGKVRDIYQVDDDTLLMVTSDRVSAFDVVMAEPVPDKGRVLTAFTSFWLERTGDLAPGHLLGLEPPSGWAPPPGIDPGDLPGRVMLVRRAEMLPVECVVRGYLAGSAWAEYAATGTLAGHQLPAGLRRSERLPEPIFTPATKATSGHDVNITYAQMVEAVGGKLAGEARELALELYRRGAALAGERGIIVADTKFELGLIDGRLAICDEVLTPDSSRFWPSGGWDPGGIPPAFDKQPLRDWLESTGWDKTPPPPTLPPDVVAATAGRYVEAYERVTGRSFADWPGAHPPAGAADRPRDAAPGAR